VSRLTSARGLVTSPNEIAQPDGSLKVADNVNIDYENVIQQRRGYAEYSQLLSAVAKQVFTYKQQIITHYANLLAFDSGSGTFTNFNGNYLELVQGLRIKALEANGNCYFTSSEGIKKISVKTASELSSASIINAGAAEAIDLSGKLIPDSSGFLPAQSKVAYRLVFGYKDVNNNLLLGSPSSRVVLTNFSQDVNNSEIFTANVIDYTTIVDQDYFLFDTLDNSYFVWFKKTTGTVTAPVNADTYNRVGILADISDTAVNTNAEVAAIIADAISVNATDVSVELTGTEIQVTINNPGDATDPAQGSLAAGEILITKVFDGSITSGTPAKAQLNFVLPPDVDGTYFYQVYRSAVFTATTGITLNDVDPGDELQFVYEAPLTSSDLSAGEVTIEENTPEAFRQVGAYLYTNAITGQTITQANERPPIAQDMALFRSSTFYSNTKTFHQTTFSFLSVDDFVSGSTKFYIGKADTGVEYTFVGVKEITDITVLSATNTTESSYFELNSANDERMYYFWMDKGTGVDPALPNKLGVRIPLHLYADSIAGSKEALLDAFLSLVDFSAVDFDSDTIRVTASDSGPVTAPSDSGTGWTIAVVTPGDGEDSVAKEVLLSQSSSVGVAIDLTARSLVRVINKDSDSPVSATYLSGSDDLPGKILLKSKSLEDVDFYIAISDGSLTTEFSPELPQNFGLDSIDLGTGIFTTTQNHNFAIGDQIYINDNPGGTPTEYSGAYTVATTPAANTFTLTESPSINQPGPLSGFVYKTTAASDNNEVPNRLMYSKTNQPEAVPSSNYVDVGSKDKQILRILALRDNLFCLKEDGIFLVSGAAAPNFSVRLLDNSAILTAPDSAVVLNNLIYCLTTQGIVSISDSGVSIVSRPIEDLIKKVTTFRYNFKTASFGVGYESDRAYLIWLPTQIPETLASQCYRYSTITNTWTRWTISANCGIVNFLGDDRMYLGGSPRNYILQERKNDERQDYADRNFERLIGSDSVEGTEITLSSGTDVEIGDVITQEQYVSVTFFNRFLKKLDNDSGPALSTYYENFAATQGTNFGNTLINLVAQLNSDANLSGSFTVPSGLNTSSAIREDFNTLITEINDPSSGTSFKDYKSANDLLIYEVLIRDKEKNSNTVTVDRETWFIQGSVQIYKAIKTEVEWAPQHFGKPEELKQIHEGSVIFDQGTISNGIVAYASDRSQDFVEIEFEMYGPGFWACFPWISIPWGGSATEEPVRTLIPQNKSRCRYLHVKFKHSNAREQYKLLGISLEPREISPRAYR
jgi:hypothetical protein